MINAVEQSLKAPKPEPAAPMEQVTE
jgi:hypothetical protein